MAIEILMPRLGWTMEEGIFGEWLKQDGEPVQAGEPLFTVESDKASQEVEAFDRGILRIPPDAPKPGDTVQVGALLAYLVQPGEPAPFETGMPAPPTPSPGAAPSATPSRETAGSSRPIPAMPASPREKPTTPKISPRARRVARELGVDWTVLQGSGRTGRIVERDVRAAATAQEPAAHIRATPVALRMAQEAGIDLAQLAAQKPGERIQRSDVEAAIAARATAGIRQSPPADHHPTTRIRRLIAQRMVESHQTTAPVTLTTEADATALVAFREQLRTAYAQRQWPVPSYNDLLIRLTATALLDHPWLNARWQEDEIVIPETIHIGLAVDTEKGLLVPVIRDVQHKSVRQLAAETQVMIAKAQAGQVTAEELQGGTFTITNLGMYGIDAFTPLIHLPQCAILGVGRICQRPAVYNDRVVPRQMMALSLTFDHRVVDGGPAARFLNTVREFIEMPALWLTL